MANSIASYTDAQIMRALLTKDFSSIGRRFEDDVITAVKMGGFAGAQNLDAVVLPSVTEIRAFAFRDTALTTLDITWSGVTSIGVGAFMGGGFNALPQNLTLSSLTALGNGAFAGTSSVKNQRLLSVSLPQWTGSAPSEPGASVSNTGVFSYCSALQTVSLPELLAISSYMFQGCAALTEIVLPKASSIGSNAFTSCSNLTKIDIGGAVTSMSSGFLSGTSKLEALILRGVTTAPTLGSSTFNNTRIANGNAYVYVPRALKSTFEVANRWSTYASQLRAIEDYPDVCGAAA